ncbi:phenylacetate--CoA ligase family protein [Alicyclobacillus sp. SP_1]|uniref:phenylacetate--CoA ligase family protein n=1 Tax=Alicyclobacillus sp. SP_1 TaxID=2942475 RepID=UPI002158578C|nr:phenylacetate--CoA ligase [Alicyclobacillus sp. SP_1]
MYQAELETMSRDELSALQSTRLSAAVRRAYDRVPFYRTRMDERGVAPEDIQSIADVWKLPFLTKKDFRAEYPFGLFSAPRSDIVRFHASSGTKGKPTLVGYTKADLAVWSDLMARALVTAGASPADTIHVAYGYGLFTGGLGFHAGVERLGATVIPASGGQTARQAMLLQDLRPEGLVCTPSYAMAIADAIRDSGADPSQLGLRYGIFGAEPWTDAIRSNLEKTFHIKACDVYGLSELMGPGVSIECQEAQNGLHIAEDHFFAEVINVDTGEPAAPMEGGELVLTALTKEGMSVVRYRTGDMVYLDVRPCVCGRTHARMSRVLGRLDDMLIIRGVNVFPSEIERVVVAREELSSHYVIYVDKQEHLDVLEVHVEVQPEYGSLAGQVVTGLVAEHRAPGLAADVAQELRDVLGLGIGVRLVPPGTLPRSEGKAVRLVDRRK